MNRLLTGALVMATCTAVLAPRTGHAQTAPTPPVIDTDAMDRLKEMGEYLRELKQFQITAAFTNDEVLTDGQKVQFTKTADLIADRPGRFRMTVNSDREERLFVYDGKAFTMWAPRTKYYTTIAAPPTIMELIDKLEDSHAIELPLVDLFRWGTEASKVAAITAAKNIGPETCGGASCQHYAFRQNGLDWEVWIQNGEFPLPRRLVITTLTDDAKPQHTAEYTWNLAPSYNDAAFAFEAPKDAKKIPLTEVKLGGATAKGVR
jgi:hypothetical protein